MNARVSACGGGWLAAVMALAGLGWPTVARGQSNIWMEPFRLQSPETSDGRRWSNDLHQFLQQSPARGLRSSSARPSVAVTTADPSTNGAVTLQDTQEAIAEARMDQIVRRIDQGGYGLPSTSARRTPTVIDRGLVAIFSPEPIRIGRTELGFSPYTAIKRRNPLCLLNPIPLSLSW
jgi:hypothetical protein